MSPPLNLSPHAVGYEIGYDLQGAWQIVVVVKAAYLWQPDGSVASTTAAPILDRDQLDGDLPHGGPLRPSDLGPSKPKVDVVLAGALRFPVPIDRVDVRLQVGNRIDKNVRVFGDRVWVPGVTADAVPSSAKSTDCIPIRWERSFGGADPGDPRRVERRNPVGSGVAAKAKTLHGKLAPSFEDPADEIASWKSRPAPVGFGPIASHWSPRAELAGTYDEAWRRDRFPFPPADLDSRFFNVAPMDQQLDTYLPGETVSLTYMTDRGHDRFALPELTVPVTIVSTDDFIEEVAVVDTILIEPEDHRLLLTARASAPLRPGPEALHRVVVGDLTRGLRSALERGKDHALLHADRPKRKGGRA